MPDLVHIVCIKHGSLYSVDYVNFLQKAISRNTTLDFTFTCYTEDPSGIDPDTRRMDLPLTPALTGWWYKLWLFSKECAETLGPGRILFFDLDTVIVGNIDSFLQNKDGPLVILRDLYAKGPKNAFRVGSAIMSWNIGWGHYLWESFSRNPYNLMIRGPGHGDQGYIQHHVPPAQRVCWQDVLPPTNRVVSFKADCGWKNKSSRIVLPHGASVVCFHGKPRPHEVLNLNIDWIDNNWR